MRRECPRSADVAAAVVIGERFVAGDSELRQHVDGCPACADLVRVMTALRSERDRWRRGASVPAAGLVWWRAQLRQRQQAARTAAAPVTIVHGIALTLVLALAVFLAWTVARTVGMPAAPSLPALPVWLAAPGSDSPSLVRDGLILAATAWLILGPVALYFALRRD